MTVRPLLTIMAFARRDSGDNVPSWLRTLRRRRRQTAKPSEPPPPRLRLQDLAANLEDQKPEDREADNRDLLMWRATLEERTRERARPSKPERNSNLGRQDRQRQWQWQRPWERLPRMSDDDEPPQVGGRGR